MSAEGFAVDLGHLDRIISRMRGLSGFLTDTFDEIDRQAKVLRAQHWDSSAADAYAAAHAKWIGEAQEFVQGVTDAGAAADRAHGRYGDAVHVNVRMARG